ncbi:hypothetical protein VP01_6146g2, partial [Puccinia sorghi]
MRSKVLRLDGLNFFPNFILPLPTTFNPERGRPLLITTLIIDPPCRDIRNNIEKIVVPDNPSLKLSILESRHDSPLAGHFGKEKTYSLISQDFSWPGMTRDVKDYVNSCYDCNRNKSLKHRKYG